MKALKRDSDALADLVDKFRHIAGKFHIVSFYEDTPLPGAKGLIVDKTGANMMSTDESSVMLSADHSSMCRFSGQDDPQFKLVYEKIAEAVGVRPVFREAGLAGAGAEIGTEGGYVLGRDASGKGARGVQVSVTRYTLTV